VHRCPMDGFKIDRRSELRQPAGHRLIRSLHGEIGLIPPAEHEASHYRHNTAAGVDPDRWTPAAAHTLTGFHNQLTTTSLVVRTTLNHLTPVKTASPLRTFGDYAPARTPNSPS
jgi:hypothetical protein